MEGSPDQAYRYYQKAVDVAPRDRETTHRGNVSLSFERALGKGYLERKQRTGAEQAFKQVLKLAGEPLSAKEQEILGMFDTPDPGAPDIERTAVGFVANFFDALGIGSFATSTQLAGKSSRVLTVSPLDWSMAMKLS